LEAVAELRALKLLAVELQVASLLAMELLAIVGCWVLQGVGVDWEQ